MRADALVVARGLAASRAQAQALIMAGEVSSGEHRVDKPGALLAADAELSVAARPRFVSRGGDKLDFALGALGVQVAGRVCLDVGASTGGFTDCLLQRGAARVYAVDVGYGQLAHKLRVDDRVDARERVNARELQPGDFSPAPDLAVVDASFIGIGKLVPAIALVLRPGGELCALVKPSSRPAARPPPAVAASSATRRRASAPSTAPAAPSPTRASPSSARSTAPSTAPRATSSASSTRASPGGRDADRRGAHLPSASTPLYGSAAGPLVENIFDPPSRGSREEPDSLRAGLDDVSAGRGSLRSRLDDVWAGLDGVSAGLDKVWAGLDDVWAGRGSLRGRLDDVWAGLDDVWAGRDSLRGRLDDVWAGRGSLRGRRDDVWAGLDDVWAGRGSLRGRRDDVWAGLDDVSAGRGSLWGRLDDVWAGRGKVWAGLDDVSAGRDSLRGRLDDVWAGLDDVSAGRGSS